ncbi:MAG: hypothetical protein AAFO69_16630, partial [Bacteroidota bacterium]
VFGSMNTRSVNTNPLSSVEAQPFRQGAEIPLMADANLTLYYCFPSQKAGILEVVYDNGLDVLHRQASLNDGEIRLDLPEAFSTIAGQLKVRFFDDSGLVFTDLVFIEPNNMHVERVESFCGPKHLVVGKNDFSMVVSSVLDIYDNVLPEGTAIGLRYQQGQEVTSYTIETASLYGYRRLYAGKKSGYGAISVLYDTLGSQSFRLDYFAADPEDFQISYVRQHTYADGEQLVEFSTSVIADHFGNVISDGTVVEFLLEDRKGAVTVLKAVTIGGVATGLRYAPQEATGWKVTAMIPHYAMSKNTLQMNFEPSVTDFDVSFDRDKNVLKVGPVIGFMGQWVRNGTDVMIRIAGEESTIYQTVTKDGMVNFPVSLKESGDGNITISVSIGGITQILKI